MTNIKKKLEALFESTKPMSRKSVMRLVDRWIKEAEKYPRAEKCGHISCKACNAVFPKALQRAKKDGLRFAACPCAFLNAKYVLKTVKAMSREYHANN